jgi:hypothetical protein
MSEGAPPKPAYEPPKKRWRMWDSYKMDRYMQYAAFPSGRFISRVLMSAAVWIVLYNGVVYLIKGSEHPINNYRYLFIPVLITLPILDG